MPQYIDVGGQIIEFPDGMQAGEIESAIKKNRMSIPVTKPQAQPQEQSQEQGMLASIGQGIGNVGAGLVRGAGSIGSTIISAGDLLSRLSPQGVQADLLRQATQGNKPSFGGIFAGANEADTQRRNAMDSGLQDMGANTDSILYKGGKLAGEIAGTAGTGGALSNVLGRTAMATKAPAILDAIRTSGMTANGLTGLKSLAPRMLGGGISGGVAAGMINPDDAKTGAMIGGMLPPALMGLSKLGGATKPILTGGQQAPEMVNAVNSARASGYVIPPTQANPTLSNRLLEGMAGKISTAQNASAKNQAITNSKAATALGLNSDTKITPDVLQSIRSKAGDAYEAISNTGMITPPASYSQALDDIAKPFHQAMQGFPNAKPSPVINLVESLKSNQFDAASAVSKIKELRTAADDAFRSGNTDIGRASKRAASELESVIEEHLTKIGQSDLLNNFKDARQMIAKTYTVEKALNQASGTIDAKSLARQLQKGKPLSGDLKDIAEFASRFPKAAQPIEGMGSLPQTSPLDLFAGSSLAAATSNTFGLAAVAARPAARSMALSKMVQDRLIQRPQGLLSIDPALQQFGYQAMPALTNR